MTTTDTKLTINFPDFYKKLSIYHGKTELDGWEKLTNKDNNKDGMSYDFNTTFMVNKNLLKQDNNGFYYYEYPIKRDADIINNIKITSTNAKIDVKYKIENNLYTQNEINEFIFLAMGFISQQILIRITFLTHPSNMSEIVYNAKYCLLNSTNDRDFISDYKIINGNFVYNNGNLTKNIINDNEKLTKNNEKLMKNNEKLKKKYEKIKKNIINRYKSLNIYHSDKIKNYGDAMVFLKESSKYGADGISYNHKHMVTLNDKILYKNKDNFYTYVHYPFLFFNNSICDFAENINMTSKNSKISIKYIINNVKYEQSEYGQFISTLTKPLNFGILVTFLETPLEIPELEFSAKKSFLGKKMQKNL